MKKPLLQIISAVAALAGLCFATGAQAELTGNAVNGEKKAAMCIGCHGIPGYRVAFPEAHQVPMISGQAASYIAVALEGYQKGDRKHPTMRALAGSLSAQDVADLAAFYEQQGARAAGSAEVSVAPAVKDQAQALIAKGDCISCHGADFSKAARPQHPKLAGQNADYLYVALKSYQTKGNANIGRNSSAMVSKVEHLSHAELKALAQYLASLEGDLRVVEQGRFR